MFQHADESAHRRGWTRSQLYTQAIRNYLADEDDDPVTTALDAIADELAAERTYNAGHDLIAGGHTQW